jgi:hypothetical protein
MPQCTPTQQKRKKNCEKIKLMFIKIKNCEFVTSCVLVLSSGAGVVWIVVPQKTHPIRILNVILDFRK